MVKYTLNIPCLNNPKEVKNILDSIKKQTLQDCEVVVIDSSDNDKIRNIVNNYNFKHISSKRGLPHQRNKGFANSKGDWIIWIDSDHTLDKNFLKSLDDFIKNNDYQCIAAKHEFIAKTFFQKIIKAGHLFHKRELHPKMNKLFHGGGLPTVLNRSVYKKIGKFDESLYYGEDRDYEIRLRKKYKVGLSRDSIVYIEAEKNLKEIFRQSRNYGSTIRKFLNKNFSISIILNMLYHASPIPLIILTLIFNPIKWLLSIWLILFIVECLIISIKTKSFYGLFVPFLKVFRSTIEFYYVIKSFFKDYAYREQR